MTIQEFDKKYSKRGGFRALDYMKEQLFTAEFIGAHFGVSKELIQQFIKQMYGTRYDPRPQRTEKIVSSMLENAKKYKMTLEDFKEAYYYASKHYFEMALVEGVTRKIFRKEKR